MYIIAIRDNTTEDISFVKYQEEWSIQVGISWTNGELLCDCVREIEFLKGKGYDSSMIDKVKKIPDRCGFKRYTALYAETDIYGRVNLDLDLKDILCKRQ